MAAQVLALNIQGVTVFFGRGGLRRKPRVRAHALGTQCFAPDPPGGDSGMKFVSGVSCSYVDAVALPGESRVRTSSNRLDSSCELVLLPSTSTLFGFMCLTRRQR